MVLALLTIGTMALAPYYLSLNPNLCRSVLLHPNSPPLLLRAGSHSLFIDARRLPVYCCCVHAPPPSLFFYTKTLPYCCTIYLILAFSLVFYLTLFFCLNGSVYCFLDLALGARTIDSCAIDLVYINRDCLGHLWDQRRQAKLTKEIWNLTIEDYRAVAT
jgi:hypothetical protein